MVPQAKNALFAFFYRFSFIFSSKMKKFAEKSTNRLKKSRNLAKAIENLDQKFDKKSRISRNPIENLDRKKLKKSRNRANLDREIFPDKCPTGL